MFYRVPLRLQEKPLQRQMSFLAQARIAMHKLPPEGDVALETSYHDPQLPKYASFSALYYINQCAVTYDMARRLKKTATMLSVGSGASHMERFLVQGLKVPKENIFVSDIPLVERARNFFGSNSVEFSMNGEWPDFRHKFDYIIFPQSFEIGTGQLHNKGSWTNDLFFDKESPIGALLYKIVASKLWNVGADVDDSEMKEFLHLMEDMSIITGKLHVISEAMIRLKNRGKIIIVGSSFTWEELAYVVMKLEENLGTVGLEFIIPSDTQSSRYVNRTVAYNPLTFIKA
ncbi:MAG: hypothetical protein PHS02_02765 [Candidatus ainarchaeum sp.]|nr:hypothetical protein [Candidatus ainarchaeum sp.]